MDDQPLDDFYDDSSDPQDEQQNEQRPHPPSRLDRLMGAKDRSEKEAQQWDEIEQRGTPLPSADQDYDVTQPIMTEPPRKEGDTPTGRETPPEGTPRVSGTQGYQGVRSTPSQHPTDAQDQFAEPPFPNEMDQGPGGMSQGGQPHRKYQPPPRQVGDVRVDSSGMPLPPKRKQPPPPNSEETIPGASSYSDELYTPPEPTLPSGYERPEFEDTRPAPQPLPPPEPQRAYIPQSPPPTRTSRVRLPGYSPQPPAPVYQPPAPSRRSRRRGGAGVPRFSWGCLARTILLSLIGGLVVIMLTGGGAAIYYARVTAPSFQGINTISDLQSRALQFETTRIRDHDGNVLYEINDPNGGFRDYKTLDEMSPWIIVATVATEERAFFTNPGFSIPGIIRAVVQNYREGQVVSGASTITQQLTRALLLPEEQRYERSYSRKIKEIFLASELGRRFSKKDILELYLNQAYYGNFSYGIEAASQTYFHKSAKDLTLAEASFLAGIPQAPAVWDPVQDKPAAVHRQEQVLTLMFEGGCLDTGDTGLQLPCMTQDEFNKAQPEIAQIADPNFQFQAPNFQAKYPHWVVYIQQQLEADERIGRAIYTSGFDVYTTLDPRMQDLAQQQVDLVLAGLVDRNVHNASVVVLNSHTGAVLAMVGSRDFYDETIDGQVNVALTLQQPGSSIKPFTYLTAFRHGWNPATVIWDVPISYEIPGFGVYEPVDYDGRYRGPVSVRTALSNSLNIPAVQTLDYVTVPELLKTLNDVGITTLGDSSNPKQFGLSLTLGAGEVRLIEWVNAFNTINNLGQYRPIYSIERIERNGQVIEGYPYQVPEPQQVVEPEYAYLIRDILSDKEARVPSFGRDTPLSPPYPAGAKTGTTNDFRDNWTMGFTSEIVVGVWVGNTDNSPMINVSGVTGAGPIWRGIMDGSQQWYPAQAFIQPPGGLIQQQTVCRDDGALPSPYCQEHSETYTEIFSAKNPPPPADQGLYRQLRVNTFTGLIANDFCPNDAEDKLFLYLPNPSKLIDVSSFERNWLQTSAEGQAWAAQRGIPADQLQAVPPTEQCGPDTPIPQIVISDPAENSTQHGKITIMGTADAPNFSHYYIDFGLGPDPQGWGVVQGATSTPVHDAVLGEIDLSPFEDGPMTIRVTVVDAQGHHAEKKVTFNVQNPTETPKPTDQPTNTPAPTITPLPTSTSPAVSTP